ncbi:hypothetical protein CW304_10175 [Bacillus sp. UFRGS-B20]|nr:hypothetical protein CW304_10175 [Bacillus sp. UFRGS-B20]
MIRGWFACLFVWTYVFNQLIIHCSINGNSSFYARKAIRLTSLLCSASYTPCSMPFVFYFIRHLFRLFLYMFLCTDQPEYRIYFR